MSRSLGVNESTNKVTANAPADKKQIVAENSPQNLSKTMGTSPNIPKASKVPMPP